jgi:hypothetical protein
MDDILNQGRIWRDRDGVEHTIADMDGRYALNVYEYLKRTHKAVAFRHLAQLSTMRMPDADTAAYDIVSTAVEREIELIQERPFHWLLDKPLMRALAARVMHDRIKRDTGQRIAVEAPSSLPNLYQAPEFRPQPPVHILPDEAAQQPGDETRVFLVWSGCYEDRTVHAVFVGNRVAAYKHAAELDRYESYSDTDVEAWDDHPEGGSGVYGQIRRYPDPWTRIQFQTLVDLETGKVEVDTAPYTEIQATTERAIESKTEPVGVRGRYRAQVTTTGPDTEIDEVRRLHADAVNKIRASVMEDITEGGR